MNLGEVSLVLKQAGLDVTLTRVANGRCTIILSESDASRLAEMVQGKGTLASPRRPKTLSITNRSDAVPEELQAAMDANPEAEFVMSCAEQWEECGFLSERQLEALERWGRRRGD